MRSLQGCDKIVHIHEVYESPECLYLVLDYKRGGSIKDLVKKQGKGLSEKECKYYISQVLEGLAAIQEQGIIHRDLTPQNLFLDFSGKKGSKLPSVSIGDFGLSFYMDIYNPEKLRCGTPSYMAPEVIQSTKYSMKSDVYTLGCTLFFMITGSHLYRGVS
jgi:serine/threonine protein kinase